MNKYIKYKRFSLNLDCNNGAYDNEELQKFFDQLITDGYEIIYYNEVIKGRDFKVTTVCGKVRGNL